MSSPLINEIRGDWSNLKGTEYHFVYALWLLLRGEAASIAFYAGNDLHAHPVQPPFIQGDPAEAEPVGITVTGANEDIWIQLKATEQPWTCTELLNDNLLANFLSNALLSEQQGRQWRMQLISPGPVRQADIESFCAAPQQNSRLYQLMLGIIERVRAQWNDATSPGQQIEAHALLALALRILGQLAASRPVRLQTLKAEIEVELAYAYPDREVVRQIGNQLLGALLTATAPGPAAARPYTTEWLNEAAGRPLRGRGRFDDDPLSACTQAVERALPYGWQHALMAPRPRLQTALDHFLAAPEPVFVLAGASGVGKSWMIADWALHGLEGHVRLLIPWTDLDNYLSLAALVAAPMRQLLDADWRDDTFLQRLLAAAHRTAAPPVVILDDIVVPTHQREVFQRLLRGLATQSQQLGVKLILVVQAYTWRLHQLGSVLPPSLVFRSQPLSSPEVGSQDLAQDQERRDEQETISTPGSSLVSFLLTDLTPEELHDMLLRRLPAERAHRAAAQLRAPTYFPLRNPYLLQRYLDVHGIQLGTVGQAPAPVDVDELIDERLMQVLQRIAGAIGCAVSDVTPAINVLRGSLWDSRPQGLPYREAVRILEQYVPQQGLLILAALREAGILSAAGPIRFIEPRLRDRLFALHLIETFGRRLDGALAHLEPEKDAGVVQALLRDPAVNGDVVETAEQLLNQDARWRAAVADGLSMSSPDNEQVLALLIALTRPQEGRLIADSDACRALGRIAARGRRAWAWAAQLYLSYDTFDRIRGEQALSAAIDIAPERVAAAIRMRLTYTVRRKQKLREQERWLRGALSPLEDISHPGAAAPARRVLLRYSTAFTRSPQLVARFSDDLDTARGILALHNTHEGDVEALLEELQAPEALTRYRAARALRPVIFERPERIADALYNAIRTEADQQVLCRLLWISHPLRDTAPEPLFDALEASIALRWEEAPRVSSVALLVLSHLAQHDVARAVRSLPRQIPVQDPARRAVSAEILAYAWWACSEHDASASQHLQALATIDLNDCPVGYRIFAWRGKVLAQLAMMCIGSLSMRELIGLQFPYSGSDLEFLHVDTTRFVQDHAAQLLQHSSSGILLDMLYNTLQEHDVAPDPPGDFPGANNAQRCRVLCIDMLVSLLLALPDIDFIVVQRVLSTTQPLYILGRLLEERRRDEPVLRTARELCGQPRNEISSRELDDLTFCTTQLAALSQTPDAELDQYLTRIGRISFLRMHQAEVLAASLDAHRARALLLLDNTVRSPHDLPNLFYWSQHAHTWQNVLLSGMYRRAFDVRQIGRGEAIILCQRTLIGIQALPPSDEQQRYEQTYSCLLDALEGRPVRRVILSEAPAVGSLQRSLDYAVSLLQALYDQGSPDISVLYPHIVDRRGYWEVEGYEYSEGSFSFGSGHLGYLFPHVRLAFIAIGERYGLPDPGGLVLAERSATAQRLKPCRSRLAHEPQRLPLEYVESILTQFDDQARLTPLDERISAWLGLILLELGRLEAADQAFTHHMSFLYFSSDERGIALYNLACVYARQGRDELCRAALEGAAQHHTLKQASLREDSDLESVRGSPWFAQLVAAAS